MLACRYEIFLPLLKNTGCNILYFIYTEQVAKKRKCFWYVINITNRYIVQRLRP